MYSFSGHKRYTLPSRKVQCLQVREVSVKQGSTVYRIDTIFKHTHTVLGHVQRGAWGREGGAYL